MLIDYAVVPRAGALLRAASAGGYRRDRRSHDSAVTDITFFLCLRGVTSVRPGSTEAPDGKYAGE